VLEEAIMSDYDRVGDFMVRNPVRAYSWQPLGLIRQIMLANSFSYLPVSVDDGGTTAWRLISDFRLARYIRSATTEKETMGRLAQTLQQVVDSTEVELLLTETLHQEDGIHDALQGSARLQKGHEGLPILVLSPDDKQLIGILTAFDLL